jgi:deoxyribonuclease-4
MLLGAHVSISGGVHKAPERGREVGCDCIQIFSKNQVQWDAKPISDQEAEGFKANMERFDIAEAVIHDSYLINLASPKKDSLKKSRKAFLDEMVRAQKLGVKHLIFHPGAHTGSGETKGLKTIAGSLNWARGEFGSMDVVFLLETTSGQGSVLGHSFEQIAKIIDMLDEPKGAGVCLDTCHSYAAGYDLKSSKGYEETFDLFDDEVGLERLKAMHLNDSKGKRGSRIDRHEQIGEGHLGDAGFRNLMNDTRFEKIPMVLETPAGEEKYAEELKKLRLMVNKRS